MARTTLKVVGTLRLSEDDGLQYSLSFPKKDGSQAIYWLEVLPTVHEWPSVGKQPEMPIKPIGPYPTASVRDKSWSEYKSAEQEWRRACGTYWQAVHADRSYKEAATEFIDGQRREPRFIDQTASGSTIYWAYRDKILTLESTDPEVIFRKAEGSFQVKPEALLLIKHHVLRKERYFQKVRREVEALENIEKLESVSREPISESVRLFVWQRDKGQCVKCASRERLEFDHIIPVTAGGSNTERNVQLLCESCNRSKGSTI
jgi:hypothetical protein